MPSAPGNRRVRLAVLAGLVSLCAVTLLLTDRPDGERGGSGATGTANASAPPLPQRNLSRGLNGGQLAGQRIIVGFRGKSVPDVVKRRIRAGRIGGVILFAENLGSRTQVRRLTRSLQRIRRPAGLNRYPLLILVDQEGGQVKRLAGAPHASAERMGSRGPAFARRQGRLAGSNLKNAGFNVNLAPVLDVARPGTVMDDTDRAFGSTVRAVNRTAMPFTNAMRRQGVAATAKHFPGKGSAQLSTDDVVQKLRISRAALRKVDLAPYRPFIRSGGELVMVSSAIYPAISPKPAMFSPRIIRGELRQRLGFRGVTITDAMGAAAVTAYTGIKPAAIGAARAGMDILLYGDWQSAGKGQRAIANRFRSGNLDRRRFRQAVNRTLRLRAGLRR